MLDHVSEFFFDYIKPCNGQPSIKMVTSFLPTVKAVFFSRDDNYHSIAELISHYQELYPHIKILPAKLFLLLLGTLVVKDMSIPLLTLMKSMNFVDPFSTQYA